MTRVAATLGCGILTQALPVFVLAGMAWELRRPRGWNAVSSAIGSLVRRARQAISSVALKTFGQRGRQGFQRFRRWIAGRKLPLTILALLAISLLVGLWQMGRNWGKPAANSAAAAAEIALAAEPSSAAAQETSGDDTVVVVQGDDLKWDRLASRRQRVGLAVLGAFAVAILLLLAFRGLLAAGEAKRRRGWSRCSTPRASPPA